MSENEENQTEAEYRTIAESVKLPSWMDCPEEDPAVFTIIENDELFAIDGRAEQFESIEQAYDFISEDLKGTPDLSNVDNSGMLITAEGRALISFTPADRLRAQQYSYWEFQQLHIRYTESPDDFYTAYHWLASHPAFYYRIDGYLNRWEQHDGLRELTATVVKDDDGKVRVLLETGLNVSERRIGTERYADYRLSAWGDTFEDTYINLAAAVNEHVTPEGIDRGLEGIKPPWLERILERIEEDES